MNTAERLVNLALANIRAEKRDAGIWTNNASVVISTVTGAAWERYHLERALKDYSDERAIAKQLLTGIQPLDFTIGCLCPSCADRRQEWQRAKEGEL